MKKTWDDLGISIPTGSAGPEVYTTCPQCSPNRKKKHVKCLSVNIEKEVWYCAHCDWRGTLKGGTEERSNPYAHKKRTYRKPEIKITDLPQPVVKWFSDRGISEGVLARNKIGYESVYMPQCEDYVNAIRFPFYRNGELVNVKSRDGKKNFRMESGAERLFFGMDDCQGETVIIVEGEIDKLSIEVAGFINCISVPDGAPSPKAKDYSSKFDFIEAAEEWLAGKRFILAVDNDEPGKVLEEELSRRLGKDRCKLTVWPDGCKDANDVLVKHGMNRLKDCIESAQDYPVEGLYSFSDISHHIENLYNNGVSRGDKTGWKTVDEFYTVRPGEFTVVTGIPGHGKSEWLDALMLNLVQSGWKFGVFSPENQPLERHGAKLIEKFIGEPFHNYSGCKRMSRGDMQDAQRMLDKAFQFILPPDDQLTIEGILNLAKVAISRKGIKGMVLDPWNEIDHSRPGNMTETEYISAALTKIRRFARANNIHMWVVAHPTKMQKKDTMDKDKKDEYRVPTPYDIAGSAHWRNKADNAITVYRNFDSDVVDIHIQKIRFKEIGKVGLAQLRYEFSTGRYKEA